MSNDLQHKYMLERHNFSMVPLTYQREKYNKGTVLLFTGNKLQTIFSR